ncbi:unnamed protein product [Scytosiphon promiscuus]
MCPRLSPSSVVVEASTPVQEGLARRNFFPAAYHSFATPPPPLSVSVPCPGGGNDNRHAMVRLLGFSCRGRDLSQCLLCFCHCCCFVSSVCIFPQAGWVVDSPCVYFAPASAQAGAGAGASFSTHVMCLCTRV